jgi:hypothetical protein
LKKKVDNFKVKVVRKENKRQQKKTPPIKNGFVLLTGRGRSNIYLVRSTVHLGMELLRNAVNQ